MDSKFLQKNKNRLCYFWWEIDDYKKNLSPIVSKYVALLNQLVAIGENVLDQVN